MLQCVAKGDGLKNLIFEWGGLTAVKNLSRTNSKPVSIKLEFHLKKLSEYYDYDFGEKLCYLIELENHRSPNDFVIHESFWRTKGEMNWKFLGNNGGDIIVQSEGENGMMMTKYNHNGEESYVGKHFDENLSMPIVILKRMLKECATYSRDDTGRKSAMRQPVVAYSTSRLDMSGELFAQVLHHIKLNDRQAFQNILELLNSANNNFIGIDFIQIGDNFTLSIEENGLNKQIPITHISDGTLRFLCQMAIYYNANRGKVVAIDEPELGLHPDMVHLIAKSIKEAAEQTQFIIATHSDKLLNEFEIENILVFEKDENNYTKVNRFETAQFKGWYEEFFPMNMWSNGDLGGNRF